MGYFTQERLNTLYRDVEGSRADMEVFRKNILKFVKHILGRHHSDDAEEDRIPLAVLKQFVLIHLRLLASHSPQMSVTTPYRDLWSLAQDMEAWGNCRIKEMDLEGTLRRCVTNALFGLGVAKVGLCASQSWESTTHQFGEVFCDCIDLDDYVEDMSAKTEASMEFQGNRYKMRFEDATKNPLFDAEARAEIQPYSGLRTNEQGDDRLKTIEHQARIATDEGSRWCEFWELWLPRERVVLTCQATSRGLTGPPLRVVQWKGPRRGPFIRFCFFTPPGCTMPSAPVADVFDLAELINESARKLGRQDHAGKTVLLAAGAATDDANAVMTANDGSVVTCTHPEMIKEVRFRGADAGGISFLSQNMQHFDRQAGNLSTIGGLGADAPTLGQEQMIQANSSAQIKDMQALTVKFAGAIMGSMCEHWMADEDQTYIGQRQIENTQITVPVIVTPEDRKGRYLLLNFDIAPYSLQGLTPQQHEQQIDDFVQNLLLPAAPQLAQQGIGINFQELIRIKAKLSGNPFINRITTYVEPVNEPQPRNDAPRMAPSTTRTNVRINRSTATREGNSMVAMQAAQAMQDAGGVEVGA